MRAVLILISIVSLLSLAGAAQAQNTRYVSDKQYVPLRSGPGNEYRIVHRGIPSGTQMTVSRSSSDGEWSEITTARGTTGWIRSQYLMKDTPAALKLESALERAEKAVAKSAQLEAKFAALQQERSTLSGEITRSTAELDAVSRELTQLKQVSGKAVQLDADNRRLIEETVNLRSEVEMLESENQRLQDKLRNEDFINGALAVLLGVILALIVPRLVPKKRSSSSWA